LFVLPLAAALLIQTSTSARLEHQLRQLIESSGAEVAVAYRTLDGQSELFIDGDKPFHAASTMKVPVHDRALPANTHRSTFLGRHAHDSE
jgi:beta-lactamase class A